MNNSQHLIEFLLDIVFPRQCLGCGKFSQYICPLCQKNKIEYFDPPAGGQVCPYCEKLSLNGFTHPRCQKPHGLDGLFVLAHYRGLIPKAIHEIKYNGVYSIADEIALLIASKYHFHFKFNYLVPVPLSSKRERERGFNQAEKLAKSLSLRLSLSKKITVANVLERTRETKPQFDLKYQERQKNLIGAFAISSNLLTRSLANFSFCLVDDVATTGATLFECAKVLKKAGADKVYGITIARGG